MERNNILFMVDEVSCLCPNNNKIKEGIGMCLGNMKYVLLFTLALVCRVSMAQKIIKANEVESIVCKVIRSEYGRKWARSINEWRNSCYSIKEENEFDTIFMCVELTLWETTYSELIRVGDSMYGFTKNYYTGECCCEIDGGLRMLYDVMRNKETSKRRRSVLSVEEGEQFLDLSPVKIITIFKQGGEYAYNSKLVYFVDAE